MFPAQIKGLEEQENRHLKDGEEQQELLNSRLTPVQRNVDETGLEEHVYEHVEQSRGLLSNGEPVHAPLVDDANHQVPKNGLEEDHARYEVAPDINGFLEVPGVDVRKAERVRHVSPAKNDTHLHLVTVAEEEVVLSAMPSPVKTKGVAVVGVLQLADKCITLSPAFRNIPLPLTAKQCHGLGEDIIVDEAGVDREDSHDKSDVASVIDHGEELEGDLLERLLPVDHGQRSAEHDDGVAEITKHDGEQEGEGNNNGNGRVDFLVSGGTIGVDDGLECFGKLVGLEISRRLLVGANLVDDGWH